MKTTIKEIDENYEWMQYNKQLRIIHSIKDDMYQMQSIVTACNSKKLARHWFDNQSTKELLDEFNTEFASGGIPTVDKRDDLPNGLRGIYIHRLLVNHVAMWASPRYSVYIMKLLDNHFEQQQLKQQQKIDELTPRAVPKEKEHDYKYLIWKEIIPESQTFVKLHLVKRHKNNFGYVSRHLNNENEKWLYKSNLPISMTPNHDIKNIIKQNFGQKDVKMNGSVVVINVNCLDKLHDLINEYFDKFQD